MNYQHLLRLYESLPREYLTEQTRVLIQSLTSLYALLHKKFVKYELFEQQWIVTYGVFMNLLHRHHGTFDDHVDSDIHDACHRLIKQTVWQEFNNLNLRKCTPGAAAYCNDTMKVWRDEFDLDEQTFDIYPRVEKPTYMEHTGRRRYAAMIQKQIMNNALVYQLFTNMNREITRAAAKNPILCEFILTLNDDTLRTVEHTFVLMILLVTHFQLHKINHYSRVMTYPRMKILFEAHTMTDEFLATVMLEDLL